MKEFIKLISLPIFGVLFIYWMEASGIVYLIDPTVNPMLGAPVVLVWIFFMNWVEGYPMFTDKFKSKWF